MIYRTVRLYCTKKVIKPPVVPPVKKAVVVSTSHDVFTNLAFETWIYKNVSFVDKHLLMLWTNNPCVVVGRHQNPWLEANVPRLEKMGVHLARRDSGGGTVFHDLGNLNLTFFTSRDHYYREGNLKFIADTLYEDFGLGVKITDKLDLTFGGFKISGTASKWSRPNSYHHCTILVDANVDVLHESLKGCDWPIKTNATKSTRSKTVNLITERPTLTVEHLLRALGVRYLSRGNSNPIGSYHDVHQSNRSFYAENLDYSSSNIDYSTDRFQLVQPREEHFPGLNEIRNRLTSWEWIYGRTPRFSASKCFGDDIEVVVHIENGRVDDVKVRMPDGIEWRGPEFVGDVYTHEVLQYFECLFGKDSVRTERVENK